jgi:hypothetical protein
MRTLFLAVSLSLFVTGYSSTPATGQTSTSRGQWQEEAALLAQLRPIHFPFSLTS